MARGHQKAEAQAKRLARDSAATPEERAAAKKKAEAGAQAAKCAICMQTFAINQIRGNPPAQLVAHCKEKHPDDPIPSCFDFLNPDGTKIDAGDDHKAKKDAKKSKKGGKVKAQTDLPPELAAAMAGAKKKKKKKASALKTAQGKATEKVSK